MAVQTFRKNNQNQIKDEAMSKLISNLSTIMWVTSNLKNDAFPNVSSVLDGVLEEAKAHLDPENVLLFQKNVQSHVLHIQIGILDDEKQKEEPTFEEIAVDECV